MQIFNLNQNEKQMALAAIEAAAGYDFKERGLLMSALTHSSYSAEYPNHPYPFNERLEFLGDAVLQLCASVSLMHEYPDCNEGQLTRYRAMLVDEPANASYAKRLQLPQAMLLGHGECTTGGRERQSIQGDLFEAFLGAVYQDGGLAAAQAVFRRLVPDVKARIAAIEPFSNPKGTLNNHIQGQLHKTPKYIEAERSGPDHAPVFHCTVVVDNEEIGHGTGMNKKHAEETAALDALRHYGLLPSPSEGVDSGNSSENS